MHVHIIGGGVIGLCSAWYLTEAGCDVTVIDNGEIKSGTSYGNAGMIVPSHFVPLASPGVISKGIRWLFSRTSPFRVKPSLDLSLLEWLYRFKQSCTHRHVANSSTLIYEFNEWSKNLYSDLSQLPEFSFDFDEKGLLMLYQSQHQAREENTLAQMATSLGIGAEILDLDGIKVLEPGLKVDALGGVYFPGDAHLSPQKFMSSLKQALEKNGVHFLTENQVLGFSGSKSSIDSIQLEKGQIPCEQALVTAGTWSARLLKSLGRKLLLQPGKGYSITLANQNPAPQIPTILTEAKVAVTPMGKNLRIGGTLELGSFSKEIDHRRLSGITESIGKYYPDVQIGSELSGPIWSGFRPCTPDGLPYLDQVSPYRNLYLATGHGMMGMSLGPASGKLISEIILRSKPTIDPTQMRLDRW